MQDFKNDLSNFVALINAEKESDEIKKTYISLVKKYHPDTAELELQSVYTNYMIMINKVYSQGKTKIKEIQIDESQTKKAPEKIEYIFKDYYGREKRYKDYLEYIMHFEVTEFDTALLTMSGGNDVENFKKQVTSYNPKDNSHIFEAMQHLYNASKCFKYIIKNHSDYIFCDYVKDQLERTTKLNNDLSRYMVESNSKEIAITK